MQFADAAAVYASTCAAFERAASEFVQAASERGLTDNIHKTKGMLIGRQLTASDSMPVELDSGSIDIVQDFTYLGSNITSDGELQNEVKIRISKAARAFGCLQKSIFQERHLSWRQRGECMRLQYSQCCCMVQRRGLSKQRV